jgi:hypothetical protein
MVIVVVACASCHVSTTNRPAATKQAVTRVVDTWSHDEMRLAAYSYEDASGERVPNGELTVMRWRVIEDDRPLVVEQAIVLVKTDDGRWRLANLYRHPKESGRPTEWRLWSRTDVPFVSHRDFTAKPTPAEVERFLNDSEWLPLPEGFRETAGGGA